MSSSLDATDLGRTQLPGRVRLRLLGGKAGMRAFDPKLHAVWLPVFERCRQPFVGKGAKSPRPNVRADCAILRLMSEVEKPHRKADRRQPAPSCPLALPVRGVQLRSRIS
jgi:hypothetical protein